MVQMSHQFDHRSYCSNQPFFQDLMSNKQEIDLVLNEGATKAQAIASKVLARVKTKLGF